MKQKMIKTVVCIEETISEQFTICHSADDDPLDIAGQQYREGALVLEPGNVTAKKMCTLFPEQSEWVEF